MKNEIKRFWTSLLTKLNDKINQWLNKPNSRIKSTDPGDDGIINFFAMVLKKVLNRALLGAEFNVISENAQAEPLKELCDDISEHIYEITADMLGGREHAECWAVPAFITVGGEQKLIHSYIGGDRVCITAMRDDENIAECYMILNAVKRRERIYFLCRKHSLSDNGDLTISYFAADENAREITADIPEWDSIVNTEIQYPGANHIGFGRYKSPVTAFGTDTVYGVPLNYNCGYIEQQLQDAVNMAAHEMKASKKMLFPDWSIVKQDENHAEMGYSIDGYIYPQKKKTGIDGNLIDEYCPNIRNTEFEQYLTDLLCKYQAQMGVRDLITHTENTSGATATEIKSKNADNLALETSIRKAIGKGNIMTLEADGIYLGIPRGLWEYDEDYGNLYEDEQQILNNLMTLYNAGAAELEDIIRYWFPTFNDKQVAEKAERIKTAQASGANKSLEDMLNM